MEADGLYDVLAVGQDVVCDSPGKQRVTLKYGQAVPYALTDTAFLGSFQPRLDFRGALGWRRKAITPPIKNGVNSASVLPRKRKTVSWFTNAHANTISSSNARMI